MIAKVLSTHNEDTLSEVLRAAGLRGNGGSWIELTQRNLSGFAWGLAIFIGGLETLGTEPPGGVKAEPLVVAAS